MPSHIFSTLGMWPDALASNLAADAEVRAYVGRTNPAATPASIAGRYHLLDFQVNAYLQLAQDRKAKAIVDERNSIAALPAGGSITAHTAFAAIPVRYAIEREAWTEAAALVPSQTSFKQAEAITWFGRALGAARSGDAGRARQDVANLSRLKGELAQAGDPYWADQVGIQETAANAWIALADKNTADAIAGMRMAADREDRSEKHIAMENRLSPMRELLGELLLAAGQPRSALREFEQSLKVVPNRFRSLAGARDAATRAGNRRAANAYAQKLRTLTQSADGDRRANNP
jgi:tetratricopeptide (TPR) repeat protein